MLNLSWGLMVWTLITFGIAAFVLVRFAFGPLQNMIDERRKTIQDSMDAAEQTRAEAHRIFEEYKETLAKVRTESEEILERSPRSPAAASRCSPTRCSSCSSEAASPPCRSCSRPTTPSPSSRRAWSEW